ncbi:MAG: cupin domain-containing protein [Acidobacteria bacterium]|nr:cupin domain-containing protein [Acidobacteriota bacterium]
MSHDSSAARIFRLDDARRVERGGGIYSVPLAEPSCGARTFLTGMTVFPPGQGIPLHSHNTDECIVILEGSAVCEVEGTRHTLEPFDAAFVPAGLAHRFVNTGDGRLRILWVYGSIDTTRTIVATGETAPHLPPDESRTQRGPSAQAPEIATRTARGASA